LELLLLCRLLQVPELEQPELALEQVLLLLEQVLPPVQVLLPVL